MKSKFIPAYLLTFVNVLGFSILLPILPFVVRSYNAPEWVYGALITCYSAFQFIGAPYLGSLSDSKGRKPVLIISQAGTLLSWFIFILALSLPETPFLGYALPLWIIAISRILDGLTGGNASVTNAYVADVTTRKEKSYIFGYLGGIAGIGLIVGPGLGGLTASSSLGYVGTLIAASIISILTLVSLFLWLKESLPIEERRPRHKQSLLETLYIPKRIKTVNPKPIVKTLFWIKVVFSTMSAFYMSVIALYLIDLFQFDEKELGTFFLVVGAFLSFNQAFLSKRFISKFGEYKTLVMGLALTTIGVIGISLTQNLYVFIGLYYIMNLGFSLTFPTFSSLIAIHADPTKQGEVMGISESLNSFAMAAFPVIGSTLYGIIEKDIFYLIAALPFTALIIALTNKSLRAKN